MCKQNINDIFEMSREQTGWMMEQKRHQMLSLMKDSEIEFPVGLIVDLTGKCGRDILISMKTEDGVAYKDVEASVEDLIASDAEVGRFPTLLWVVSWDEAQSLLQLMDTTEMLKKAKSSMLKGDWLIVGIGRVGYTCQVVAELSPECS